MVGAWNERVPRLFFCGFHGFSASRLVVHLYKRYEIYMVRHRGGNLA